MPADGDDIDALRAAGRSHPLVASTLHTLLPQPDGTFTAPPALRASLAQKLGALVDDRDRLVAALGLLTLAGFLAADRASPQAACAIDEAVAERVDDLRRAIDALGLGGDATALLGASAFDQATGPATTFEPRREPGADEARGGPLARAALLKKK